MGISLRNISCFITQDDSVIEYPKAEDYRVHYPILTYVKYTDLVEFESLGKHHGVYKVFVPSLSQQFVFKEPRGAGSMQ